MNKNSFSEVIMAFSGKAIIDVPGIKFQMMNKDTAQDVLDYHKTAALMLAAYCNNVHEKLEKGEKLTFKYPKRFINVYINKHFSNVFIRHELKKLARAFENFDYSDYIKRSNLHMFFYYLSEEKEGLALWTMVNKTDKCIDFVSIINEMNKEDFELFAESKMYREIKNFGASLIKRYPNITIEIPPETPDIFDKSL